jgi:ribosomal protein S18
MSMLKKKAKEKRKRRNRFKKFLERSPCRWCDKAKHGSCRPEVMQQQLNYRNVEVLQRLTTNQGRIMGRRRTNSCARAQRQLTRAVKQARYLALLPYKG